MALSRFLFFGGRARGRRFCPLAEVGEEGSGAGGAVLMVRIVQPIQKPMARTPGIQPSPEGPTPNNSGAIFPRERPGPR